MRQTVIAAWVAISLAAPVARGQTLLDPGLATDLVSQGMERHRQFATNGLVYIRYDKSPVPGSDTPQADVVLGGNFSASVPTLNVIERFVWDPAGNGGVGELIFDTLIHSVIVDTRYHHGGPISYIYTPRWLAYGIRNSFGLATDPANGTLWYTENGRGSF